MSNIKKLSATLRQIATEEQSIVFSVKKRAISRNRCEDMVGSLVEVDKFLTMASQVVKIVRKACSGPANIDHLIDFKVNIMASAANHLADFVDRIGPSVEKEVDELIEMMNELEKKDKL